MLRLAFPIAFSISAALAACGKSDPGKPSHAGHGSASAPAAGSATGSAATSAGSAAASGGHAGHGAPPVAAGAPYQTRIRQVTPLAPGATSTLELELLDPQGQRVRALDVVHEQVLHLLVVSKDLRFFAHEHPTPGADGLLTVPLTLPDAGDYWVYADFRPTGGAGVVVKTPLQVAGAARPPTALAPVALPASTTSGAFTVALAPQQPLAPGADVMLDFTISDASGPIADLRNYLGERGHCVIISEDSEAFLHSHPMGGAGTATVGFHTVFPKPGKYKLWAEFRPRGEPLRVSFEVEVPAAGAAGSAAGSGSAGSGSAGSGSSADGHHHAPGHAH